MSHMNAAKPLDMPRSVLVTASLLFLVLCLFASYQFGANGDEGQYLFQARLLGERGLFPSVDFFASNPPLFFLLYGGFMKIFGYSFETARLLSILLFFGTTVLVFRVAVYLSGHFYTALAVTALFALNWIFFRNNVIMKHYASSNFLIVSAVFVLMAMVRSGRERARWLHLFFGLFMGAAFSVRIHLSLALIPVFTLWLAAFHLRSGWGWKIWSRHMVLAAAGFLAGASPILYVLIAEPQAFYFNYYYYPFVLSPQSLNPVDSNWLVFPSFFWLGAAKQNLLVVLLGAAGAIWAFRTETDSKRRWCYSLLLTMAIMVCALYSLSPVGLGPGHFSQSIPYWTLLTAPMLRGMFIAVRNRRTMIFAGVVASSLYILLFSSVPLPRLMVVNNRYAPKYGSLGTINRLGAEVDRITQPGEPILDWFGSATFLSGTTTVPGFEQFYAVSQMFNVIPDEGLQRPPLLSKRQLGVLMMNYGVDVIVSCERWCDETKMDEDVRRVLHEKYVLYRDIQDNLIYVSPARYRSLTASQEFSTQ